MMVITRKKWIIHRNYVRKIILTIEYIAYITCPECGHKKKEEMPDNY